MLGWKPVRCVRVFNGFETDQYKKYMKERKWKMLGKEFWMEAPFWFSVCSFF